jgi:hypothetical protein
VPAVLTHSLAGASIFSEWAIHVGATCRSIDVPCHMLQTAIALWLSWCPMVLVIDQQVDLLATSWLSAECSASNVMSWCNGVTGFVWQHNQYLPFIVADACVTLYITNSTVHFHCHKQHGAFSLSQTARCIFTVTNSTVHFHCQHSFATLTCTDAVPSTRESRVNVFSQV